MEVLFVFLGATGLAFALIWIRRRRVYRSWPSALRVGLSAMFFMTGITHFVLLREDLVAMVPPFLPAPELLVTLTGVLELAGAVGLLLKRAAVWAAGGLATLMVTMFPANVYAALSGLTMNGEAATPLVPRTLMQLLYIAAAVAVVLAYRRVAWPRSNGDLGLRTAGHPPAGGSR
ncbi:MAG TPA: DoxX family membrane protein [Beutenbergiaceae bacterium]|nr:DoxX family membrane protein [Beutenbergiaceae bacterium]